MTETPTPVAKLHQIEKRFGLTWALRGLTLDVPAGQIIGLIGPNGAGKSTLLRLVAGLQRPTKGTINLNGKPPGTDTKANVAYVPDHDFIDDWMTVAEAASFWSHVYLDFDATRARELIDTLELQPNRRLSALSRGQRLRAGLALALARDAELYLLDEPLAHIDPRSRRLMIDVLLAGKFREGATLLMATHQVAEVERLLDYAIYIADGRIVRMGEAEALREETGRSLLELAEEVEAE